MEKESNELIAAEIVSEVLNEITESRLYREFTGSDWAQYKIISTSVKRAAKSKGFNESVDEIIETVKKLKITTEEQSVILGKTKHPKEYVYPKDRFTNALFDGKFTGESWSGVETFNSFGNVNIEVEVDFGDLPDDISMTKELNTQDKAVHDAILSLYLSGNKHMTTLMIHRVINGNKNVRLKELRRSEIENSIKKMMTTLVYINFENEAKFKKYEKLNDFEGLEITSNLISVKLLKETRRDGTVKDVFEVLDTPSLYRYADAKNQIARLRMELLDTPGHKTDRHIAVRNYLIARIDTMKSNPKHTKKVLINNIFEKYGVEADNPETEKKNKIRAKKLTKDILEDFAFKNYISGFTEEKKPSKDSRKESGYIIKL